MSGLCYKKLIWSTDVHYGISIALSAYACSSIPLRRFFQYHPGTKSHLTHFLPFSLKYSLLWIGMGFSTDLVTLMHLLLISCSVKPGKIHYSYRSRTRPNSQRFSTFPDKLTFFLSTVTFFSVLLAISVFVGVRVEVSGMAISSFL